MRVFCSFLFCSISKQVPHSGPNKPDSYFCSSVTDPTHPLSFASSGPLWILASPRTFRAHRLLPPPLPPSPQSPAPQHTHTLTHTHPFVIDSVFVPLCIAVASDEDTYTEQRRSLYTAQKLQVSHQLQAAPGEEADRLGVTRHRLPDSLRSAGWYKGQDVLREG